MSEQTVVAQGRSRLRLAQAAVAVLVLIILGYVGARLLRDIPHLTAGTVPADEIDRPYVEHPWLAYLHIAPGVVYLLGAPLQLSRRFRTRHYTVHRRLGRVLLTAALLNGIFAVVFGALFSYGGIGEAVAAVVFGAWFVFCLLRAFVAIRNGDVIQHRRWMIRAFVIGLGVGTIRIWMALLLGLGVVDLRDSFPIAFWLSFVMHAIAAEWWVRTTPHPRG
jgi:uncharacterized membrane protein